MAKVHDPDMRAAMLIGVAPFVPPSLIQATLDAIPSEAEPYYRALVLTQLAMRCEGAQRAGLLAQAVEAALGSPDRQAPLRELPRIAADPRQLFNVLLLRDALGGRAKEFDLGDLVRGSPPGTLDRAMRNLRQVTDQCYRSRALARLAKGASGALRTTLLKEALDAACTGHYHVDGMRCDISATLAEAVRCVPEHEREELPADYLKQMAARNRANAAQPREDGFSTDEDAEIRRLVCVLTYLPEANGRPGYARAKAPQARARPGQINRRPGAISRSRPQRGAHQARRGPPGRRGSGGPARRRGTVRPGTGARRDTGHRPGR